MTPKHIAEMFVLFGRTFPNWKPEAAAIETWALLLQDLDPALLRAAAVRYCQTNEFPPTPGAIRKLAVPALAMSAEEAWEQILKRKGTRDQVMDRSGLPDSAMRALQAIGGRQTLWNARTTDMGTIRSQFMRSYNAFEGRIEDTHERLAAGYPELESRDDALTLEEFNRRDMRDLDNEERRELDRE